MFAMARPWRVTAVLFTLFALATVGVADRIAYQGRLVMGARGIVVMNADGRNPVELPHPADSDVITPALSPDGSTLAFAAKAGDHFKIFTVPLANDNSVAGAPTQLTTGDGDDEQPAWSPNGRRIAFVSTQGESHTLWIMDAEGGPLSDIGKLGAADFRTACPHWSPDSLSVVFSRDGKLWISHIDASRIEELTADGMYPSWSPDGAWIAFFARRPEPSLMLISPTTKETRTLVKDVQLFGETAWSPDGKFVAFKADRVGVAEGSLWVMPAAGGDAKPLRSYGVAHGYLDWSRSPVRMAAAGGSPSTAAVPPAGPPETPKPAASAPAKPAPKPVLKAPKPPLTAAKPAATTRKPAPVPTKPAVALTPATAAHAMPAQQPTPAAAKPPIAVAAKPPATGTGARLKLMRPPSPSAPVKRPEAPAQLAPVRIISPADGATVRALVKVVATKAEHGGYVAFFVDEVFVSATIPPYELNWDTRPVPDGPHTIQVVGYGAAGGVEGKTDVKVEVRNEIRAEALPEEGVLLRYRFKPKQKWEYEIKVQAQAGAPGELALPGVAAQGGTLEAVVAQRVENVRTFFGAKTVAGIITRLTAGSLNAPGTGGVLPQVDQAARSQFTTEGEVTPQPTPGAEPIALGNLSPQFPPDSVKVGDKWTSAMTILPILRTTAVARVTAQNVVESVQWEQGYETLRIVSTFQVDALPVGVEGLALRDVTGTRTTLFAHKEHMIVRMEDTIEGVFRQRESPAMPRPGIGPGYRASATSLPSPTVHYSLNLVESLRK